MLPGIFTLFTVFEYITFYLTKFIYNTNIMLPLKLIGSCEAMYIWILLPTALRTDIY